MIEENPDFAFKEKKTQVFLFVYQISQKHFLFWKFF